MGNKMKTQHKIYFKNCNKLADVDSGSVDLVVTSPPYPMIEMWDGIFYKQNPLAKQAIDIGNGNKAFDLMHKVLDFAWDEIYRVLKPSGFVCINIGDATRTINGNFVLYSNHTRILKYMIDIGFTALPCILWRKQTNAPNKFMGSGMLPAGAYVTLEHEYILIFRKGPKREFKNDKKKTIRRESAIFWEERNKWYSDIWFDVKGTSQILNNKEGRKRSAAYPFELPYRLINMYSAKGDTILDPFLGTGTTTSAAMASGRNSIGYEIEISLKDTIYNYLSDIEKYINKYIYKRIEKHLSFIKEQIEKEREIKYKNIHYNFPVIASQEKELLLSEVVSLRKIEENTFEVIYSEKPNECLVLNDQEDVYLKKVEKCLGLVSVKLKNIHRGENQLSLF